ncbi:hypothetical protein ACH41E_06335 [Streptomyces sp. NPDC020412]|uniref:hypothetical protein n=1 Tax=Streptomyces sp. NPDC020412 TaxID=3365073 RepID=UPI0037B3F58A
MTAPTPGGGPLFLALPMPDQKSSFILSGMALAVVVFIWWLVRAIRRQGGFKPACRRLAWEAGMTRRAFTQPFRDRGVHRRRVRALSSFLADPGAPAVVDRAFVGAERVAGEGCHAPVVALSADRRRVAVVVAGRSPRPAAPPWRGAGAEPGGWSWTADAADLGPDAELPSARRTLPLVLGVDRLSGGTVVADWTCGPPAVSLEGDSRVVRAVLQALAAQLDLLPGGPAVEVTRGVHARFPGRELDAVLDELETAAAYEASGTHPGPSAVVVCWTPTVDQRERLADLCAGGRVLALVGGRLAGDCWSLHAEPGGRLLGPGLGVDVESAALSTAVSSGIKRFRRRATGWWTPRPAPVDPGDSDSGSGDDGGDGGDGFRDGSYGTEYEPMHEPLHEPSYDPAPAASVPPEPQPEPAPYVEPEPPFAEAVAAPSAYGADFAEPDTAQTPIPAPAAPVNRPEPPPEPLPDATLDLDPTLDLAPEPGGESPATRPATGVSAASRTHPERTPEHP